MYDDPPVDEIPENELGIALDEHIERAIVLRAAAQTLQNYQVELDGIADSRDLPPGMVSRARDIQQATRELASDADDAATEERDRAARIRERITDN